MMYCRIPILHGRRRPIVFAHQTRLPLLLLVLGFFAVPAALHGKEEGPPEAAVVLNKYVEVTGGKAAYEELENRISTGTCDFASLGVKANFTAYEAAPNKRYVVLESPDLGRMEEGTSGDIVWEMQAMAGPRLKEGTERAHALREATFNAPLHWKELYKKAECVGVETIAERPCYKVVLTPAEGNPQTQYYDCQSYLLVATAFELDHPMGRLNVQTRITDYKPVDGVLLPHKIRMSCAGQEQIITVEKIDHNVAIPADRFALPEEIRALAAKADKTPEKQD